MELFDNQPYRLDLPQADVVYYRDFFSPSESITYFDELYTNTPWRQDDIKVFGKVHAQPRLTALYATNGKPYSYSSIQMIPERFTFALSEIKSKVESIAGVTFTTCLLNLYRDGSDSNGWHSDDEKELGQNPVIASVSLGAERVFKFRNRNDHSITEKIILDSGSLLLMRGETQHNWHHQIPKTTRKIAPRINLTFRIIK